MGDRIKILMSDPSAKAQFESTMIHNLEAQNEASMKEVQALKIKLAAQTKPDSKATRDLKSDLARVESTLQASQYHEKELERELQEQKDQVQRGNSRGAGQKDEMQQLRDELREAHSMIKSLQGGKKDAVSSQELVVLRVQLKEAKADLKATTAQVQDLQRLINTGDSGTKVASPLSPGHRSMSPNRRSPPRGK